MGGRELVVRKAGVLDLKEVGARTTLREVRLKGHVYVELRRVGKRTIFFCNLCLTPCYSDTVLFDHLRGKLHAKRYAAAKLTLFGPLPWPFNDGVLFFDTSYEKEPHYSSGMGLIARNGNLRTFDNGVEITSKVRHNGAVDSNSNENVSSCGRIDDHCIGDQHSDDCHNPEIVGNRQPKSLKVNGSLSRALNGHDTMSKYYGADGCLTIRGVFRKEEISDLRLCLMGLGHISSRVQETDEGLVKISRIWCAWLGQGDSDSSEESLASSECDFAIVNFPYSNDLGRNDLNPLISAGSLSENEIGSPGKKRKKSLSDPEDSSLTNHCSSSGEDSEEFPGLNADDSRKLQSSRLISSTAVRRELRRRKRLAADKTCDICAQLMLPGKDVATLLNCKTGKLACSSRNSYGAFHIFHVSCLVHWILLCEFEMWADRLSNAKPARGRKGRAASKKLISSVFCPECQGFGKYIRRDELEKPTVPLSEMFLYKLKAIKAHKEWMENPEVLQKCSTGLCFPSDEEKTQEKLVPIKLLRFYRADAQTLTERNVEISPMLDSLGEWDFRLDWAVEI